MDPTAPQLAQITSIGMLFFHSATPPFFALTVYFCIHREQEFPELYEEAQRQGIPPPQVDFLDIGCGFGGLTVGLAEAYPDKVVCGMEIRVKVSGMFSPVDLVVVILIKTNKKQTKNNAEYVKERILALRKKEPGKYRNATCIRSNTMKYLTNYFKKGSIEKMFFLFADPHFKHTNHRRRIIQSTLLDEYAYLLKPGGILYTITDVEDLGNWQRERLAAHPLFVEVGEEELEGDAAAKLLEEGTEEGKKVKRNGGSTWKAIFRRV